jgi:predicted DsbA family dithiol-disulfide isomerase
VRLADVERAYAERVSIHWRTFPLIPDQRPGRRSTEATRESRRRAGAEESRALFVPPPLDIELPASSLPALTAAKCAERQSPELFAKFHAKLFAAHFGDNLDVSRPDVLWRLARECALDVTRFERDYSSGEAYQSVLHDYAEGAAWFGVSALPTVIFNEKVSLVGALPLERYRLLLDWFLAGEPGGLIPLDLETAAAPGSSAVGAPAGTEITPREPGSAS